MDKGVSTANLTCCSIRQKKSRRERPTSHNAQRSVNAGKDDDDSGCPPLVVSIYVIRHYFYLGSRQFWANNFNGSVARCLGNGGWKKGAEEACPVGTVAVHHTRSSHEVVLTSGWVGWVQQVGAANVRLAYLTAPPVFLTGCCPDISRVITVMECIVTARGGVCGHPELYILSISGCRAAAIEARLGLLSPFSFVPRFQYAGPSIAGKGSGSLSIGASEQPAPSHLALSTGIWQNGQKCVLHLASARSSSRYTRREMAIPDWFSRSSSGAEDAISLHSCAGCFPRPSSSCRHTTSGHEFKMVS